MLLQILENTESIADAVVKTDVEILKKVITKMGVRLVIDLTSVWILIRFVYYPVYKRAELFFTYFIFNVVIFLICFLLNKVELSMGAAFGLFAVFSMLRYRTEDISLKDMTYLFLVIAMGLIAAVTKIKDASETYEYVFLLVINAVLIGMAYLMESKLIFKPEQVQTIFYENIELVKTQNQKLLITDIEQRTGLKVHRVSIQRIDFLRDAAIIKVYYYQ